jgi:hypothetical protein
LRCVADFPEQIEINADNLPHRSNGSTLSGFAAHAPAPRESPLSET